MTTATKQRSTRKKTNKKKPKWTVISFKEIEAWRIKLGLSKAHMAEALNVTNSTFHNWRRGTTVPREEQQEDILKRIRALETGSGKPTTTTASKKGLKKNKKSASKKSTSKKGKARGHRTTGPSTGSAHKAERTSASLLSQADVLRADPSIGLITAAYIQTREEAPSAGSIIEFVRELQDVL